MVPRSVPIGDFPIDPRVAELSSENPARLIAIWAAHLRHSISRNLVEDSFLDQMIETSIFVAIGVFRAPSGPQSEGYTGFPAVSGYQFGAALLRAKLSVENERTYFSSVSLDSGRLNAPLVQLVAHFTPQSHSQDGYVAAAFKDDDGADCGITAAHIVDKYSRGQTVPILCSDCKKAAKLRRKAAPGIDAAVVEFRCSGPGYGSRACPATVRAAIEGETVQAHFGNTGVHQSTVAMALQSPTQIKCAALAKHFLISVTGQAGDSGSLISSDESDPDSRELIGMYLGETDCEDQNQNHVTYGYALELKQAADILGATILSGDYNE